MAKQKAVRREKRRAEKVISANLQAKRDEQLYQLEQIKRHQLEKFKQKKRKQKARQQRAIAQRQRARNGIYFGEDEPVDLSET
jgi:hypothetical protein